jgi:ABC-type polysaccharide/polyol phosphate export permease
VTVAPAELVPPPATTTERKSLLRDLREVFTDLWTYRELLAQITRRDIKIRYKQAAMGFAWALFMPILVVMAGLIIRWAIATVGGISLNRVAAGALMVKGLAWSFFVGTIGFATPSLSGNMSLVTKIYFPREVLPLAAVGAVGFDSLIAGIAVLLAVPFFGAMFSPALLWIPLLLVFLVALTAAAALFLSCANLFFRDVKYIVQVLLTFGIFFTPVLYEPAVLGAQGHFVMLNPIAPVLEGLRLAVFHGHNLLEPLLVTGRQGVEVIAWSPWYLFYSGVWAVGGVSLAAVLFHRAEFAFAEFV